MTQTLPASPDKVKLSHNRAHSLSQSYQGDKNAEKPGEKAGEKVAEKPSEKVGEKASEKPVDKLYPERPERPLERIIEREGDRLGLEKQNPKRISTPSKHGETVADHLKEVLRIDDTPKAHDSEHSPQTRIVDSASQLTAIEKAITEASTMFFLSFSFFFSFLFFIFVLTVSSSFLYFRTLSHFTDGRRGSKDQGFPGGCVAC